MTSGADWIELLRGRELLLMVNYFVSSRLEPGEVSPRTARLLARACADVLFDMHFLSSSGSWGEPG